MPIIILIQSQVTFEDTSTAHMSSSADNLPTVVLTMGGRAEIGPEIVLEPSANPDTAPMIHASVYHGTAFDIAGENRADARSRKQAMWVPSRMAAARSLQVTQ
jgi:4-hydroxy-L-threonine phosphate dehydrogenase PdxA